VDHAGDDVGQDRTHVVRCEKVHGSVTRLCDRGPGRGGG
jgi:hypothetical protein